MPLRKVSWPKRTCSCHLPVLAGVTTTGAEALADEEGVEVPAASFKRWTRACRVPLDWALSSSGFWAACISARTWSLLSSSSVLMAGVSATSPARSLSSKDSMWCVKATTSSKPNMPAEPLIVWAQRNSAPSSSRSSGTVSSWSSRSSSAAICSCASLMKAGSAPATKLSSSTRPLMGSPLRFLGAGAAR